MSTYKSLGGPPSGLVLTNDAELAQRLDAITYPGLTANFDAAKAAALAITLLDRKVYGRAYAAAMVEVAQALAAALAHEGLPVYAAERGATVSHQFAVEALRFGGGQSMAKRLRRANILASGIGLPIAPVEGDMNGLRLGTPEIVRWGFTAADMPTVAGFIARALASDAEPARWRARWRRSAVHGRHCVTCAERDGRSGWCAWRSLDQPAGARHPRLGVRTSSALASAIPGHSNAQSHGNRWHLLQRQERKALCAWYKAHLGIDVKEWGSQEAATVGLSRCAASRRRRVRGSLRRGPRPTGAALDLRDEPAF